LAGKGVSVADVEFAIEVQAEGVGTDATAEQVVALGESITAAEKVITPFDSALEAASANLDKAASAAEAANEALSSAEAEFKRLERASTRAGKAVEKAAAKGQDTTKLAAAAREAEAAVRRQATAVDRAKTKATSAAAAERRLAAAHKRISSAAGAAAAKTRALGRAQGSATRSTGRLARTIRAAGPLFGRFGGRIGQVTGLLGKAGWVGALILAVAAVALLAGGLVFLTAKMLKFAIAADKATSKRLEKAWERAGKHAKALFEGVRTDKLVKPAESMLQLLDKNTSAGKGLAKILETVLNPVIDGIVKAAPLAKEFFKGVILGALRAVIFVLRLRNAIVGAIPKETRDKIDEFVDGIVNLENAAKAGEETFAVWFLPFEMFIDVAAEAGVKALWLASVLDGVFEDLSSDELETWILGVTNDIADWASEFADQALGAARDFIDGLVEGITKGAGAVAKAAKDLATSAIDAIKKVTKSGSPSRLMIEWGRDDFAGAIAMGQEQGEGDVRVASKRLGEASLEGVKRLSSPTAPATAGGDMGTGEQRGQASITVQIHDGAIVINAPSGDSGELAREVRRVILEEIDGAALQAGAGELATGVT
jgi:hypothetical protein